MTKKIIITVCLSVLLLGGTLLWNYLFGSYSDGYRVGVPAKLSKKGFVFKTWEGSINVGGAQGTTGVPTVWDFSVKDDGVVNQINKAIDDNKRVKLYYYEKYTNFFWQGETKYFVFKVEEILK